MLEIITGLPAHVFGVRAKGEVDKNDLENVLLPGLEKQAELFGEINYLLVLETGVQNFTAGAWVRDLKAGISHFKKWKKIAVVTDQKFVEFFSDVFTIAVPGEAKGFSLDKEQEAIAWVSQLKKDNGSV